MRIDTKNKNEAFLTLINDRECIVFLDANVFIPPDRTALGAKKAIDFSLFKETILSPLFDNWKSLAIHESVYKELVASNVKEYADDLISQTPPRLIMHSNKELSVNEEQLFNTVVDNLAQYSKYQPDINNSDDRGEIHSLAFMSVKNYLYFSANDKLPIRLIKQADELNTGLQSMGIIQMYELIYALAKFQLSCDENLRNVYKYMYYSTPKDKKDNPSWGDFLILMNNLYGEEVDSTTNGHSSGTMPASLM